MLFPKPRPHVLERRDVLREREREARAVRAAIVARDQRRCRCCGRAGSYEATGSDKALHLHHLRYRSKGGADVTENLITLCRICHALIHARQLWPLGTNADRLVSFEVHEAAVLDVFGTTPLPRHVRIITESRAK